MPKTYILKTRGLFVVSLSIRSDEYPDAATFKKLSDARESARRIQEKFTYQVDVYRDYGLETQELVLSILPDGSEVKPGTQYAENNLYVE